MPSLRVALLLAAVAPLAPSTAQAAEPGRPQTIPALRAWAPLDGGGTFALRPDARIVVRHRDRAAYRGEARQLAADLGRLLGRRVATTARRGTRARTGDVVVGSTSRDPQLDREGYGLRIGRAFTIVAPTRAGAFYGGRSLLQLVKGGRPIPRGRARDWPRHPERGMMVDAGRKAYSPRWLAAHIRELAYLKLNYLHLHLSDNQGFRIESTRHPEIVSEQHLTKAQVRELLALAERHHVTVVPEIDMPGHLTAALEKHPEWQLKTAAGTREAAVLDVSNPDAVRFARSLVEEYLELFDGPYWHIGADEVLPFFTYPVGTYPSLDAHARERYGPDATAKDAIHGFVNDIDALVRSRGRTSRMWHDDLNGGVAVQRNPGIVTEWWIDVSPLSDAKPPTPQELLDRGHKVMNAGWYPTYHVNGIGGSPVPVLPNIAAAYASWDPHEFHGPVAPDEQFQKPPDLIAPGEPRNLGAKLHLWNDNPTFATEAQDAVTIAPGLRMLAQKTWQSRPLVPGYAEFVPIGTRLGHAPAGTSARRRAAHAHVEPETTTRTRAGRAGWPARGSRARRRRDRRPGSAWARAGPARGRPG
jgi:hexosaminidase